MGNRPWLTESLEKTKALTAREMKEQLLDSMDLERERGITIKLNSVQLKYHGERTARNISSI